MTSCLERTDRGAASNIPRWLPYTEAAARTVAKGRVRTVTELGVRRKFSGSPVGTELLRSYGALRHRHRNNRRLRLIAAGEHRMPKLVALFFHVIQQALSPNELRSKDTEA